MGLLADHKSVFINFSFTFQIYPLFLDNYLDYIA